MIPGPALGVLCLTRVVAQLPDGDVPKPEGGQGVVLLEQVSAVWQKPPALDEPTHLQKQLKGKFIHLVYFTNRK